MYAESVIDIMYQYHTLSFNLGYSLITQSTLENKMIIYQNENTSKLINNSLNDNINTKILNAFYCGFNKKSNNCNISIKLGTALPPQNHFTSEFKEIICIINFIY